MPPSCALLGGFAICAWVALLCNITRTRNVSEYMLILALCLVILCNRRSSSLQPNEICIRGHVASITNSDVVILNKNEFHFLKKR